MQHPLAAWCERTGVTLLDLGRRIGLRHPNGIYRYLHGRCPAPQIMAAIERETNGEVPSSVFLPHGGAK